MQHNSEEMFMQTQKGQVFYFVFYIHTVFCYQALTLTIAGMFVFPNSIPLVTTADVTAICVAAVMGTAICVVSTLINICQGRMP